MPNTLGVGSQLAVSQPLWSDLLRWGVAGGVAVLFFGSVLLHELAHALVARRHGMGGGSVTLLFFGGGVTQGQEPRRPADEALVAAAGPIASGLLTGAFLGAWFVSEFIPDAVGEAASQVALALAALNALLALLNLLPVYPLDGGRILRAVLWGVSHDQRRAARGVALTSRVGGWGLIGAGAFVWLGGDALDGLMLAVCGWFVSGTARGVERRLAIEDLVAGMRVENAMDQRHAQPHGVSTWWACTPPDGGETCGVEACRYSACSPGNTSVSDLCHTGLSPAVSTLKP